MQAMASGGKNSVNAKSRLFGLGAFLFVWALLIVARLAWLQVVQFPHWMLKAQHQQQRSEDVSPQRGIIYDRNGQELAMTVPVESVFAVPSEIPDQKTASMLLGALTGESADALLERMQAQRNFAWVARKVDADTDLAHPCPESAGHLLPEGTQALLSQAALAAQVLGYVGMEDTGLAGIEHLYQDQLNGEKGRVVITMDARRKWFGHMEHPPEPGANVVLTIDEKIQYIAEKELAQAMEETQAPAERWWCRIRARARFWRWPTRPLLIQTSHARSRRRS